MNELDDDESTTPGVPSRAVALLAFCGVVVAGLLGGLAAYGIVDTGSHGDAPSASALAAVVGAAVCAIGAGVVAVLVLRARAQWHVARDEPGSTPS